MNMTAENQFRESCRNRAELCAAVRADGYTEEIVLIEIQGVKHNIIAIEVNRNYAISKGSYRLNF